MSTLGFIATVDVGRMPSEDLAALLRVSSMLASTLDLPLIMQTAITSACEVMGLDTGAIYLFDGSTLVLQAHEMPGAIDFLAPALDIPWCHHERWDGTGYPRGLAGEEIPLAARIFSVVDVYDALTSDRHYRPGWSGDQALEYIREETGRQFDPRVVEAFFTLIADRGSQFAGPPSRKDGGE